MPYKLGHLRCCGVQVSAIMNLRHFRYCSFSAIAIHHSDVRPRLQNATTEKAKKFHKKLFKNYKSLIVLYSRK